MEREAIERKGEREIAGGEGVDEVSGGGMSKDRTKVGENVSSGLPTNRKLPTNMGLHFGELLLGVKAPNRPPKPQKMLEGGVFTLILVPVMAPSR